MFPPLYTTFEDSHSEVSLNASPVRGSWDRHYRQESSEIKEESVP